MKDYDYTRYRDYHPVIILTVSSPFVIILLKLSCQKGKDINKNYFKPI